MATFVQLCAFSSQRKFNANKDTRTINQVLGMLQKNGGKIVSVIPAIGGWGWLLSGTATAVYVITYEASQELGIPNEYLS